MARGPKKGLEYFPIDIDMDGDDKICLIVAELGELAFGRIVKLLMAIYREGYYKKFGEDELLIFAEKKNIPIHELKILINKAAKRNFFDKGLYEKYEILTSSGIQKRYIEACINRNQIVIFNEICLVDLNDFKEKIRSKIKVNNCDIKLIKPDPIPYKPDLKPIKPDPMTTTRGEKKKGKEMIYIAPDGVKNDRTIYHLIEEAFVKKNQEFNYKREGPHIKQLEERCLARASPEDFAKALLVTFWKLTHSAKEKLFKDKPFLPSILDSGGLYPYVLKAMENQELTDWDIVEVF